MVQTWQLRKVGKMSSVCIQLIVVAVMLSLSDVACQTVHNISISDDVHSGRQPLTQQQISEIVQHHNILRARESAANMELMVWNTSLASLAATWAARCEYKHPETDVHPQFVGVGQNSWQLPSDNAVQAVYVFYNEKEYYTYDNNTCDPGKECGHYTQVVWADSGTVGCAVHRCHGWTFRYIVCNYWPAGNFGGRRPYTKGPACSKCGNGAGWCKNKLCNTNCSSVGEDCWCAAICYNCANLDLKTCRCKCAKGWLGVDCTERCKDNETFCHRWNKGYCDEYNIVVMNCPVLCGVCEPDPHAKEGLCLAVRGPAADTDYASAQTVFIKSHQSTIIFVMVIIAFTISSYDAL